MFLFPNTQNIFVEPQIHWKKKSKGTKKLPSCIDKQQESTVAESKTRILFTAKTRARVAASIYKNGLHSDGMWVCCHSWQQIAFIPHPQLFDVSSCGLTMVSEELTAQSPILHKRTRKKKKKKRGIFFYLLHFLHILHICGYCCITGNLQGGANVSG